MNGSLVTVFASFKNAGAFVGEIGKKQRGTSGTVHRSDHQPGAGLQMNNGQPRRQTEDP